MKKLRALLRVHTNDTRPLRHILYVRGVWRFCEWALAELERVNDFTPLDNARSEGWCDGMEWAANDVYHFLKDHPEMTPKDIRESLRWQARSMR